MNIETQTDKNVLLFLLAIPALALLYFVAKESLWHGSLLLNGKSYEGVVKYTTGNLEEKCSNRGCENIIEFTVIVRYELGEVGVPYYDSIDEGKKVTLRVVPENNKVSSINVVLTFCKFIGKLLIYGLLLFLLSKSAIRIFKITT